MAQIAIIDFGMGNLSSVRQALEKIAPDKNIIISADKQKILNASHVIFPGQGAMPDCMVQLEKSGLLPVLETVLHERAFLGICLGMQILFEKTQEGNTQALSIFQGDVQRFSSLETQALKVPHMGWNTVKQTTTHPLWSNILDNSWFYFVHSFYVCPAKEQLVFGQTDYGQKFCSAVAKDNIFAVQFHPEKSTKAGLQLLANFVNWHP